MAARSRGLALAAAALVIVAAGTWAYARHWAALRVNVPARVVETPAPSQREVPPGGPARASVLVGRPAPGFTLPLLSGGTLNLRDLGGRPVVLNFWASWCVPCREETPLLVRLHKRYGPRIVFVGVNVEDEDGEARRFLARYRVDYPVVRSSDERLIVAYKIMGLHRCACAKTFPSTCPYARCVAMIDGAVSGTG